MNDHMTDAVPGSAAGRRGAARFVLAAVACVLASSCASLRVNHAAPRPAQMQIDGLTLASRASNTAEEVIALLGLADACSDPGPLCASRILESAGTVREGTRLIAAADVLHRFANRANGQARWNAWSACASHSHRYLYAPGLAGRQPPLIGRSQLALRLYNVCTEGLLHMVTTSKGSLETLFWEVEERDFPRSAIAGIELASAVRVDGLRTRQAEDGIGVPAVATGRTDTLTGTFPPQPFALPINIRFEPAPGGSGRLIASDASLGHVHATAFGPMPLARDVSASYALAAVEFERELGYLRGLFGADAARDDSQLRVLAPIDRRKTPVILVHGLASSPMTWANMVNELLGDPEISEHYQFWLARYSTALPLLVNRQQLAGTLRDFRKNVWPDDGDMPAAVLVGHSMGGVLSRLLVTDSGTALWDAAFSVPPELLHGRSEDVANARDLFIFTPLKRVDEVVFIAAPHRGSATAESWTARVIRRFVHLPAGLLGYLGRLVDANPDGVRPSLHDSYRSGGPNSLGTLSPDQPVSRAGSALPVIGGVEVHSIIGIRDSARPELGDGIVSLKSASWPEGSVDYVEGAHDLQAEPATIAILKRILLERLARGAELP